MGSTTGARVSEAKGSGTATIAAASELPLSMAFESDFSAFEPKYA